MGKMKLNVLRLTLIFLLGSLAQGLLAQGVLVKQAGVIINANCHGYLEYLPPGYNPATLQKYPLLLVFNGFGAQGDGSLTDLENFFTGGGTPPEQVRLGWWVPSYTVNGQTFSFIMITPQFIRSFCCDFMPSTGEVDGVINYMIQHYKVDESRIYMTGVSSGAYIPLEYVASGGQFAKKIAAIVPFATTSWVSQNKADTVAKYNVPVWAFHNLLDLTVNPATTINWVNTINSPTAPISPPTPMAKMRIDSTNSSHVCWWDPYLGNYTENGLNIYQWMLQYSRPAAISNGALPVNFSLVNAKCGNNEIKLSWETSAEKNTAVFAVEKSSDGRNWNSIGNVKAAGQSNAEQSYSFTDKNSSGGLYRIVANDIDGKQTYSPVIKSACNEEVGLSLYPNPIVDKAIFNLNLHTTTKLFFRIIDNNGRVVSQEQKLLPAGTSQFTMNLEKLSAGVYTLSTEGDDHIRNIRFVKH